LSCEFKKESIKKNDVFEKVKIDRIYKDDLKNQEMVVKQQLSKSIKNDISFEKKLHDEVPSGKNYIISYVFNGNFLSLSSKSDTTLLNNSVDCFPLPLCLSTRLFMCGSLLDYLVTL
jgi:hypothetical protein